VSALLLKMTLAPALVASASLAGRRFGPRVGGWLIGFPVVAGPVLWFYAREQGAAFAAGAAAGTVLGTLSLCCFLATYAWSATHRGWGASTLAGWLAFVAATFLLQRTPSLPLGMRLLAAFAALLVTARTLPRLPPGPPVPRPRHDLALRLAATAALVVTLTGVAGLLGPSLSGLITPFPVATTILVVFAHREAGPGGVVAVLGGFIPSLYSFACFCASLSYGLHCWPLASAFAGALLVSLVSQAIVLGLVRRGVMAPPTVPGRPQAR
jgi:hypothetical protein